jgi:hypothetical protein
MLSRVLAAFLLLAWAALLVTPALDPAGRLPGGLALVDAGSLSAAAVAAGRVLLRGLLLALRFAPLGALAVLALPDQGGRLRRLALVALPATALATLLAWGVLALRARSSPGPFEIVLPAAGILLGVGAGLAWRRGWSARLLFLPRLVAQAVVLVLLAAGLAVLALDTEPALGEPAPPSSAEKRRLVERFRGKDPRKIPPGETCTLRLSGPELDRLAAWAARSVTPRVRTAVSLAPGGFEATAALRLPRTSRWLNLRAAACASIEQGRLAAADPQLRVGQLAVPGWLLRPATGFLVAGLQGDRDLRRVLPAVESLALAADAATLRYGRVDMPPGLVARLVWGEEASQVARDAVDDQVDQLLAALAGAPEGDARFGRALEAAFASARERGALSGAAAEENRSAILALGIVLGHPRLAQALGERLDDERRARALRLRTNTTLRGRHDWVRHFSVSAALTVLSAASPSDAAGLLKEELDADGGSGFSFADLLADRAGTTFAEVATRDDAAAQGMQQRLASGFRVDDFFPAAADLPEGIQDAELQSRYGGVGGALYSQTTAEIERRLSLCAAYRDGRRAPEAPPPSGLPAEAPPAKAPPAAAAPGPAPAR